jgi:large subunit ribosomal protein L22
MQAIAHLRYLRVSPRKVKIVLDLIRNKDLREALAILSNTPKLVCRDVEKLVRSAAANAENNNGMDREKLFIEECYANKGPTLKRIRPRAQGRAYRIEHRTSHITLVLNER